MREHNQLRLVLSVLQQYDGSMPLANYLGEYFRQNRQMGSRDRKQLSHTLYSYFRLGKALSAHSTETRLAAALYLCSAEASTFNTYLCREFSTLSPDFTAPLSEKMQALRMAYPDFHPEDIFPFAGELSPSINPSEKFYASFLKQPYVWIRVRQDYREVVLKELETKNLAYVTDSALPGCLGFTNATPLSSLGSFARGYFEIQDRSSQQTGEYMHVKPGDSVWDCCAASGGKSLMLWDKCGPFDLTVSDIRPSVLRNLAERFRKAGISSYHSSVTDLTRADQLAFARKTYDCIIADVPCTGSGTWGRTPEMIAGFSTGALKVFAAKQKQIVSGVADLLRPSGELLYITCSLFAAENEEAVQYLVEQKGLLLLRQELIQGYTSGADTMFFAKLKKA